MKKLGLFTVVLLAVFIISGCGTVPKQYKEEVTEIKSRVDTLESRVDSVESKQSYVERLAGDRSQNIKEFESARTGRAPASNVSVKPKYNRTAGKTKMVQTCLRNAGFYEGKIDGIRGKMTRKAIRDFQRANGLSADGVVGPKTWEVLRGYASSGMGGSEEGTK